MENTKDHDKVLLQRNLGQAGNFLKGKRNFSVHT